MKPKTLLLAALLLFAPAVMGAITIQKEDFESYSPGTVEPAPNWFSWSSVISSTITADANAFGNDAQSVKVVTTSSNAAVTSLTTPGEVRESSWFVHPGVGTSDSINVVVTVTGGVLDRLELYQSGRVERTVGTPAQLAPSGTGGCDSKPVKFHYSNIDYDADTFDLTITENGGVCYSVTGQTAAGDITEWDALGFGIVPAPNTYYVDDYQIVTGTVAAPDGVSGSVTNNEVNPDEYLVKFRLSPDDTNQDTGAYTYELYYDTGSGATLYDTYPPGVAVDGVIADQPMVSTTGNIDWYAVALEPLLSLPSANSCTITLDSTTLGDSATCGTPIPGEEETGSDLTGPQGGLFGGDKAGLAAALQISEAALEIVIGLMLLMLLIAGGWFAYGIVGAAGLGTIGLILNYALGLFPFWTIYVIGFIGTAIAILLVKVMRR